MVDSADQKPSPPPAVKAEVSADSAKTSSEEKNKKERVTNCTQCNKRVRRKNWYYRNGKYFCSKGCSKTYAAKNAPAPSDEKSEKEVVA